MWQGVGAGGRMSKYVAGVMSRCGGMWQEWGYVVGAQAFSHGRGHVAGVGHVAWCGAFGRVWGHVAGGGGMWQGVEACHKG